MEWLKIDNIDVTERALFDLCAYPTIAPETALAHLNHNKTLLILMLKEFLSQEMPVEKPKFIQAFVEEDWDKIEKLTHKIMGGIRYLGLIKMQHACQHLERYYNCGYTRLLPALYQQFMLCFDETEHAIRQWLALETTHQTAEKTKS